MGNAQSEPLLETRTQTWWHGFCCGAGVQEPLVPSSTCTGKKDYRHGLKGFLPAAPDMRREEERIKSFDTWPVPCLLPKRLAANGFYYLGRSDEVRCAFCKEEYMHWVEVEVDPVMDHQRWVQCPFLLKQQNNGNMPLDGIEVYRRDEGVVCVTRLRSKSQRKRLHAGTV